MDWHSSCFMSRGTACSRHPWPYASGRRGHGTDRAAYGHCVVSWDRRDRMFTRLPLLLSQRLAQLQERRKPRPALRERILPAIPVGPSSTPAGGSSPDRS